MNMLGNWVWFCDYWVIFKATINMIIDFLSINYINSLLYTDSLPYFRNECYLFEVYYSLILVWI